MSHILNKTQQRGAKIQGDKEEESKDSPVGVRGLVNDVLVGGEQDQSVLAEIHSHVCAPASIQTAADGERRGIMRLQRGAARGGGARGGGSDCSRQRGAECPLGPCAGVC